MSNVEIDVSKKQTTIDVSQPAPPPSPVSSCVVELEYLVAAKLKILKALAKGGSVVSEIEIRGRIVKHRDLLTELNGIKLAITKCENKLAGKPSCRPVRSKARLGYGRRC